MVKKNLNGSLDVSWSGETAPSPRLCGVSCHPAKGPKLNMKLQTQLSTGSTSKASMKRVAVKRVKV